jgi:hypothetical protein
MKTLLAVATVGAALLTGGPVAAGDVYADAALLATIESVRVVVSDQVEDNCLFNASGIKARLSVTLEHSGIAVSDVSPWMLHIIFHGWAGIVGQHHVRGGCLMEFDFELRRPGPANTWIVAAEDGGLSIGPDALDSEAMMVAEEFVDKVIAAILAARRSVGTAGVSDRRS